jgi:hypothetical protein
MGANFIQVTVEKQDLNVLATPVVKLISGEKIVKVMEADNPLKSVIYSRRDTGKSETSDLKVMEVSEAKELVRLSMDAAPIYGAFEVTVEKREGDYKNRLTTGSITFEMGEFVEAMALPSNPAKTKLMIRESGKTMLDVYIISEDLAALALLIA